MARLGGARLDVVRAAFVGALALTVAACAGGPAGAGSGPASTWLAATGFPGRQDWPSASLHLSRVEMATANSVSDLLRRDTTLVLRPPRGDGWGVHRRLPGGGAGCALGVMLNGVRMIRAREERLLALDGLARPGELDGLEVHDGEAGPALDRSGCGTVLLWSERITDAEDEPFHGRIAGVVAGEHAGVVREVRLEPGVRRARPDARGHFEFYAVLPGAYEVVYLSREGPLARRSTRVYAYAATELEWFYPVPPERRAPSRVLRSLR